MGKSRRLFLFLVAVAAYAAAAFSSPLRIKKEGWEEKRSTHFFIYCRSSCSKDFIRRLKEASESYYRTITDELHFYRHDPWVWERRAKIYVYRSKEEYLKETKQPSWSAGYAVPAKKEIFTYEGSFKIFKGILAHEMAHLVLHEFVGLKHSFPLWMDEGVAMYMQYKTMGLLGRIVSEHIKPLLRGGDFIPLRKLLDISLSDLDKKQPLPEGGSRRYNYVDKFYLEALSVIYFLFKHYDKYNFINLCRDLRSGVSFSAAFRRHYYTLRDLRYFDRRWREFYLSR